MDSPPVPKPRTRISQTDLTKRPVPLPRTKSENQSNNEKITASDILRSIGTVSKQITDDMAQKVHNSARSANEKLEKSFLDGTKFAKDGFERTLNSSRTVRDQFAKSVVDSTRNAGLKLRSSTKRLRDNGGKKKEEGLRCMSMPVVDVSLFENLHFHSPLLEQKKYSKDDDPSVDMGPKELPMNLNLTTFDDLSIFCSSSDMNNDSISNLSYDSREQDHSFNNSVTDGETESVTYDTPKDVKRSLLQGSVAHSSEAPLPEPLDTRFKDDDPGFFRQNSLYENWNSPPSPHTENYHLSGWSPQVRESTIYEFDPLKSTNLNFHGKSNELLLLESFLSGDNYGAMSNFYGESDMLGDDSESISPPTPPERFDSLALETSSEGIDGASRNEGKSKWFVADNAKPGTSTELDVKPNTGTNTSVMRRFSNILKLDTLTKSTKEKNEMVERPSISQMPMVVHNGILTRIMSGGVDDLFKNSQSRYCVLCDQKLTCYSDTTNFIIKEAYPLQSIISVQIVLPLSSSTSENSYCFELNVNLGSKNSNRKILFSCYSAAERHHWAQKIVEHLSDGFPVKYSAELTRFGWCFIREGVGAKWNGAWLMLIRRTLAYYTTKDPTIRTVDLRKTWRVVTQEADEVTKQTCPTDGSSNLLLDNPPLTLYLHFYNERELKSWRSMIKLAAHNNGILIHHQQLTKEDIPTIVEKCINFIYVYGSMSEGIYRRAGASAATAELLARFRRDAWAVRLSKATHTEHDVAAVLKRFFRDLHDSLIPKELHDRLLAASDIQDTGARCAEYARLLGELPTVARHCARKLFAHLHFVHTLRDANRMSAENLAAVWAPTIMPAAITSATLQEAWSTREVGVVRDLIARYPAVYAPSASELERERAMLELLRRVASGSSPSPQNPRAAGDLRVWIYLGERVGGRCEQVTLTPNKTAEDVCLELCGKMARESHLVALSEVVCGGALRRILLYPERLLEVVLRWSAWPEEHRKDNYLMMTDNQLLHEIEGMRGTTSLVCGELKYASEKSKAFKLHMFELKNSNLSYFKDKQGSCLLGEWPVKDHLWYIGHEHKRNPQTRWAITFIPRDSTSKSCKERPWFGSTIAGSVGEEQLRWLAAITFAQNPGPMLPSPRLIIT